MPEAKLSIKLENAKHKESIPNLKLLLLEIVQAQFSNAKVSERTKEPRGKEVAKMFRMNAETFKADITERIALIIAARTARRADNHSCDIHLPRSANSQFSILHLGILLKSTSASGYIP